MRFVDLSLPLVLASHFVSGAFVTVPASDASIIYSGATVESWFTPNALAREVGESCPSRDATARTSTVGATFEYRFNGTAINILTSSGSGSAAYNVTIETSSKSSSLSPTDSLSAHVEPNEFAAKYCIPTYQSDTFKLAEYIIRVVFADANNTEFALMSLEYDDGGDSDSNDNLSHISNGVLAMIAILSVLAAIALVGCVVYFCFIRRRSAAATKTSSHPEPRRGPKAKKQTTTISESGWWDKVELGPGAMEKAVADGVLSSTPTFVHLEQRRLNMHERLPGDSLGSATPSSVVARASNAAGEVDRGKPRRPLPDESFIVGHESPVRTTAPRFRVPEPRAAPIQRPPPVAFRSQNETTSVGFTETAFSV